MTIPNNPFYGPFHMETDTDRSTVRIVLQTRDSKDSIALNT
jgi:hypothetical protein